MQVMCSSFPEVLTMDGSLPRSAERSPGRFPQRPSSPYHAPVLIVWGRIEDVTRGSAGRARDVVITPYRNIE